MNLIPCPGQTELIYLYLDQALLPPEKDRLLAHLEGCPACQAELARLEALFAELASLDEITPPAGLVSQVMARLPVQQEHVRRQPRSSPGWLILAGQTLVGLALLISALPLFSARFDPSLWDASWLEITSVAHSLAAWAGEVLAQFGQGLATAWPPPLELLGLQLAPGPALLIAVCLGLVWGFGNFLLLNHSPHFFRNRGVS